MTTSDENGGPREVRLVGNKSQLVLTFDHNTFALQVGGEVENYDVALAMLAQATRAMETQQKLATIKEMQAGVRPASPSEFLPFLKSRGG